MEKISWTDHVRNEEVLLRVNVQRNKLHKIRKRKVSWCDAPGTQTTGPKNHAVKHRLRTQKYHK